MNTEYNADMYLTPSVLNEIENKIEELTDRVQTKLYEDTSPLRTIEVGDDLSGKTLYLSFPRNAYEYIDSSSVQYLIETDDNYIAHLLVDNTYNRIYIKYNNMDYIIYGRKIDSDNPYMNIVRFKLPNDFGTVTEINDEDDLFQYIKIYEDENIIPNYVKKTWSQNEIVYMQNIDNIEKGVENLGDYCTKPLGWIMTKEWLQTNSITNRSDYNVGSKGISYNDVNRWIVDLKLIDNVDIDHGTFWNTDKTEYTWED